MTARVRFQCVCGHSRDVHSTLTHHRGTCANCPCEEYVYAPEAVARARTGRTESRQADTGREPHPSCPLQDPDCMGFHPTIGW